MSSRRLHSSKWHLLVFAAALLLCNNGSHSALGQVPKFDSGVSRTKHSPDPQTKVNRLSNRRTDNRPKQTPSALPQPSPDIRPDEKENEKQQAIEQALEQGNQARGTNAYDQALAHYQQAQKLDPQEARAFYGIGNLYFDLFCNDSAIEAYRKALERKKDYLEAHVGLGYAYADEDRYDEAGEQFRMALALAPDDVEANIGLGLIYAQMKKYNEAIKQITRVINAPSVEDQATAHVALGEVYEKQKKWPEAIAQYEQAIRLKPDFAKAYLELGSVQCDAIAADVDFDSFKDAKTQDLDKIRASAKKGADNIKRAIELHYNRPKVYAYLGMALVLQFRFQDAATQINIYFAKIKELESRLPSLATSCDAGFNRLNATGHAFMGAVYLFEGDFEADKKRATELLNEAIEQFNQAVQLKEDYDPAYDMIGTIYLVQENYEEAIKQYKKAILFETEETDKAESYRSIGLAYYKLKHYPEALENLNEATRLDSTNPMIYVIRGLVYDAQENYEEAINQYQKALLYEKGNYTRADVYTNLGADYYRLKQFSRAVDSFEEAKRLNPNSAGGYINLGNAYLGQNDFDEAITAFTKAIELGFEDSSSSFYALSNAYAGKYDQTGDQDFLNASINWGKKSVQADPDYADVHFLLGKLYIASKNKNAAREQYQQLVRLKSPKAEALLERIKKMK